MDSRRARGYTLLEIMAVVAIVAIIARVSIPMFSSTLDRNKLAVAAEEVGNALRFSIAEAKRTNAYILVDAQTTAGHLKVFNSNSSGANLGAVTDPHTKRAIDIDTSGSAFSSQVTMAARFMDGGTVQSKLLISPGGMILQTLNGGSGSYGALASGSGVVLTLGSQSVTVALNETTTFVTIP